MIIDEGLLGQSDDNIKDYFVLKFIMWAFEIDPSVKIIDIWPTSYFPTAINPLIPRYLILIILLMSNKTL